jgi:hypothetical protein
VLHCSRLHSLSDYFNITLSESTTVISHTIITLHTSTKVTPKSREMSDWNFIDRFGKEVAKRAGISKDEAWNAMLRERLPGGSEGGSYRYRFDEEAIHGFSQKLKD